MTPLPGYWPVKPINIVAHLPIKKKTVTIRIIECVHLEKKNPKLPVFDLGIGHQSRWDQCYSNTLCAGIIIITNDDYDCIIWLT